MKLSIEIGKVLSKAFLPFVLPRIKNMKAFRDFQAKWKKDNYPLKMTLMFQAGVDDAKAFLDISDELINRLLEDKINRSEIFRWIIEGVSFEDFAIENLNLDPYFERYPRFQDDIVSFFKLILVKIDEYKETNWDPEFQNILNGIVDIKQEMQTGFNRLEQQQKENHDQVIEKVNNIVLEFHGNVGYEDLKVLLKDGKVKTVLKKAEERLRHARKKEEQLELNAIIASCYFNSGFEGESIPYLYTAISFCDDENRKNRLHTLINIFQKDYVKAIEYVERSIEKEGSTVNNVELLANIYILVGDYENSLSVLNKNEDKQLFELKIRTLLGLERFEEANRLIEDELINDNSKSILLLKADYFVMKMEHLLSADQPVDPKKIFESVKPILDLAERDNENSGQLFRINELKAAIYFRTKQYKEASIYYQSVYDKADDKLKETYIQNVIMTSYLTKDWERTITLLEIHIEKNRNNKDILFLAKVYIDSGRPEKAYEILQGMEIDEEDKPLAESYLMKLECLYLLMKFKEVEILFTEVEAKDDPILLLTIKGSFAILKNDWNEAIQYYEPLLEMPNVTLLLEIKMNLIEAYKSRGTASDFQKIVGMIPKISNWAHHDMFIHPYFIALYKTKQYELILSHYYNDLNEKNIFVQEIVATVYFETNWFNLSKNMYESMYFQTQGVKYLFKSASCMYYLGEKQECFEALLLAEQKINQKPTIEGFHLLNQSYLDVMNFNKALEYAYKAFMLENQNPDVWRAYFSQFLHLSSLVENCNQEYIDAYQQVFTKFNENFPDQDQLFEQFEAINEQGQLSNVLIDKLKSLEESQNQYESMFVKNRFSPELIRTTTQKDPYQVWAHIVQHPKLRFWVNQTGTEKEVVIGMKNILFSKRVMCDIFSLFTLNYLDLLHTITVKKGFQTYIYQEQLNALLLELSKLKFDSQKGKNAVSYSDGKLISSEASPTQVVETISLIENLIDWITKNCIIVGNSTMNLLEDNFNLAKCIDDPLVLCNHSSFNLLVDSNVIGEYALERYKVNTFSVVDLVHYLRVKKRINNDEFNELIGKLIILGYRYVTASPEVFIYYLQKNDFTIESEVTWLFNYLKDDGINEQYTFNILVEVLGWIWKNDIIYRHELTVFMYDILIANTSNQKTGDILIQTFNEQFELTSEIKNEFQDTIIGLIPQS